MLAIVLKIVFLIVLDYTSTVTKPHACVDVLFCVLFSLYFFFYISNVKKNYIKILTSKSRLLCWFWVILAKISSLVELLSHCEIHQSPTLALLKQTAFEKCEHVPQPCYGNWQTPGCAQRDCDFTSHSISNILLLWIKSSVKICVCMCLFIWKRNTVQRHFVCNRCGAIWY